jgi:hypothetical protein
MYAAVCDSLKYNYSGLGPQFCPTSTLHAMPLAPLSDWQLLLSPRFVAPYLNDTAWCAHVHSGVDGGWQLGDCAGHL